MESNTFLIKQEDCGQRIDKYLTARMTDFSRARIQKLLDEGQVMVNNKIVKANHKLKLDEEVFIEIPDPIEVEIVAENIPLDIVYEDKELLIINKPKGMVVHPALGHYSGTLVNALKSYLPVGTDDV